MTISQKLTDDMKAALRAGNKVELGALRMALAALKRKEIDEQKAMTDEMALGVLEKLIKQGRDARQQFEQAGRAELAAKEAAEIAVFERYMPKALEPEELDALIQGAIESTGAAGIKDMGRVMAEVKSKAAGRADMAAVSSRVREILTAG